MASPHLCNKAGNDWVVGRKILGSFTVSGIRSGPLHNEYAVSHHGRQDKLVVRVPHAALFKTEEEQQSFDEKIHQWIRLGMHPHLEACYGLVPGDASAYSLEDIKGSTLTNWVRSGKCTLRSILSLLMQICHGLEYLHAHGISHLGLVPDRVIITRSSLAKNKGNCPAGCIRWRAEAAWA
jgi:serine/threonine protein kinase